MVPDDSRPRRSLPVWAAVVVVTLLYLGIEWRNGGPAPTTLPSGYYGLLTEGLAHGHLHFLVEPDPRLAKLANPWAAYQGIPRIHDATYFHGHYYLYFGIAPVILLFGPWHALFGTYLTEGTAAVVFGYLGFLFGLVILRAWTRGASVGSWWRALGVLAWGLATYVAVDMEGAEFYAVPILCAFMCVTAALAAILCAVRAPKPGRAVLWMALASLAWGGAVAGRPHYVLSLPLLLIPVVWLASNRATSRGDRLRLFLAAVAPSALIGAGLAWYNYARFGSITEFGFHYQFTASDQRFIQMWNPGLILPNLGAYCFSGTVYTVYFPFVTPTSDMVGILAWTPLALVALAVPFTLLSGSRRHTPEWAIVALCAFGAGVIHLFALSVLPIGTNRYDADFDPEFILCALGIGALFLAARPKLPKAVSLGGTAALLLLAVVSIGKGSLLSLQRTSPPVYEASARLANKLVSALHVKGASAGGIAFKADLSKLPQGQDVPLVTTGTGGDTVFVRKLDHGRVTVGFVHTGNAPFIGSPFVPPEGKPSELSIEMGSLCPPPTAPAFADWDPGTLDLLEHRVVVKVDGQTRLSGHSNFYATDAFHVWVGARVHEPQGSALPGVSDVALIPLPNQEQVLASGWRGPVRLHLRFPDYSVDYSEPLISTGSHGAADMVYVTYLGRGLVRFGHDANKFGAMESDPVKFDPTKEHTLDVDLGALDAAGRPGEKVPLNFSLRFDGKWVMNSARPSHPTKPAEVVFGFNSQSLSTAKEAFSGPVLWPEAIASFSRRTVSPSGSGPLEMSVQFKPMPKGEIEALLTTGVPGKGDLYTISYLDPQTIEIEIDHWGVGLAKSEPIPIDPEKIYVIDVTAATFLPPLRDPAWQDVPVSEQRAALGSIIVTVNGDPVVTAPWSAYLAQPSEINVGTNPLGGSMNAAKFGGTIVEAHRAWGDGSSQGFGAK